VSAWRLLQALCADGLLGPGKKGRKAAAGQPGRASEFRWLGEGDAPPAAGEMFPEPPPAGPYPEGR
jgi:hypothetical protein